MSVGPPSSPQVKLGDVLFHVARPLTVDANGVYREIGIRSHGKGLFHKAPVTGATIGDKRVFYVEPGDFVLNIVFAWEGAIGVVSEAERGMIASHRFPCFRAVEGRVDLRYLERFFHTPAGLELLDRVSPGGAGRNRTLNRTAFMQQEISLPPLSEQRRIVARIDGIAEELDRARVLRESASSEMRALETATTRQVFAKLTDSAPLHSIARLVAIRGGGTPSKSDPSYWQGSIPWITPKDMKVRRITDSIDHISESATAASPAKLLVPGAVLIVTRGMILAHTIPVAVLDCKGTINQDMKALIPKEGLDSNYLCHWLWAYNAELLARVEKSSHDTRKFETSKLLSVEIPVPSLAAQRRIVSEVDSLREFAGTVSRTQAQVARELDALLPAILDRAFAGAL